MATVIVTTINLMLFEGGALIQCLSANDQGQALATRVQREDTIAYQSGKTDFDLELDPIELGIAFEAVEGNEGLLANAVAKKLKDALVAKLTELGVNYGGVGEQPAQPGLGGLPQGWEPPADEGTPLGGQQEPAGDGQDPNSEWD